MRGNRISALCAAGGCCAVDEAGDCAAEAVAGWVSVAVQAAFNSSKPMAKTLLREFNDRDMT